MRSRFPYGSHYDSVNGICRLVYDYDEGPYDSSDHGAACQCDECMADDPAFAEELHYRTYTPSIPEDTPIDEEREDK